MSTFIIVYIVGVISSIVTALYYERDNDILLRDLISIILLSVFSWILFVAQVIYIITDNLDEVIIKKRK